MVVVALLTAVWAVSLPMGAIAQDPSASAGSPAASAGSGSELAPWKAAQMARGPHGADGKFKVFFINPFGMNDFQLIQNNAGTAAANNEPFASKFDYSLVTTDQSVEAQNAAITNALSAGADALVFQTTSDTGQNEVIKQACEAGVVVVTWGSNSTLEDCEYKIGMPFDKWARDAGRWFGRALDCNGNIIMDRGATGIMIFEQIYQSGLAGMQDVCGDKFGTDLKVVGEYLSGAAQAGLEGLVSPLLAANPDVDGVFTAGYCGGVVDAFDAAGLPRPVLYCQGANENFLLCAEEGMKCFINSSPPVGTLGAWNIVYDVLVDHKDVPAWTEYQDFYSSTHPELLEDADRPVDKIELGVNALPDMSPSLYPYHEWVGAYYQPTLEELLANVQS
jgi:ribose transport system substrate-binding protein